MPCHRKVRTVMLFWTLIIFGSMSNVQELIFKMCLTLEHLRSHFLHCILPTYELLLKVSDLIFRCCTSDCRLKPNAICSPKNSPCCSSNCQFLPSTHLCLHENRFQCKLSSYCTLVPSILFS